MEMMSCASVTIWNNKIVRGSSVGNSMFCFPIKVTDTVNEVGV